MRIPGKLFGAVTAGGMLSGGLVLAPAASAATPGPGAVTNVSSHTTAASGSVGAPGQVAAKAGSRQALKSRATRLRTVRAGKAKVYVKRTKTRNGTVKVQWRTTSGEWKKFRTVKLKKARTNLTLSVKGRSRVWRVRAAGGGTRNVANAKMPVGDLPGWKQIFTEDFTTDAPLGSFLTNYSANWSAYEKGWVDTSKHGVYDPDRTLYAKDGELGIWLHTENGQPLVSAPLPRLNGPGTSPYKGFKYGRVEVKFRATPTDGYRTAWMLWPDANVHPDHGEINFPEGELNSQIYAFAHYAVPAGADPPQDVFQTGIGYSRWHIATTEWSPGKIRFLLDGKVVGVSTKHVPNKPMHYVMQTETNLISRPPRASTEARVKVDWITAYSYDR